MIRSLAHCHFLPLLLGLSVQLGLGSSTGWSASAFLHSNDVVCLVGGANAVEAQEHGYFETLLRLKFSSLNLRFRSLAHEGDTVFAQPRDFNYPSLPKQLEDTQATVVLVCFGQIEALAGREKVARFADAYERLLEKLGTRRIVLMSPIRFEASARPLPDLSHRNQDLQLYVAAIRALAEKRGCLFVDLFGVTNRPPGRLERLTSDGFHLTASGHYHYDSLAARQLADSPQDSEVTINPDTGGFSRRDWERVRQAVVAKNRFWTAYYRPMNWAFLGGDRTDQPSSRDHRDPKVRWFPEEMQRFVPLIDQAERQIASLTSTLQADKGRR